MRNPNSQKTSQKMTQFIIRHSDSVFGEARIVVVIFAYLFFSYSVSAQDVQCRLMLSDLPQATELKGFRLGMTMDEVKARAPQVRFGKTTDVGVSKTSFNPDYDPRLDKSTFRDVRTVSLDFLDGKLNSLWIGYDNTFRWQTVDAFVKGISQSMGLPNAWVAWKVHSQQMKCADFQITVSLIAGSPSFRILDQTAEETIAARRSAKEEEASVSEENIQETEPIFGDRAEKIYYPTGCAPSREIEETNLVMFKTPGEAAKAGFKPAKNCQ